MFHFTLKQLSYVEATGRLGSIAKAAMELNISQSSVTAAIDALEVELGHSVFVRTPSKGIHTTPEGDRTLQLIRHYIDDTRHFASELQSREQEQVGDIRVACYATAAPAFLPTVLKHFSTKYPKVKLHLLEGDMQSIAGFLDDGKADIAFTYAQPLSQMHAFESLIGAPPYVLLPVEHPLADLAEVNLSDLEAFPMILLELPYTREYFLKLFTDEGLKPQLVHSSRSSEMVRALVSAGMGFSILNIRPADYDEKTSRYRAIPVSSDQTGVENLFGIASRAGTRKPRIVQQFVDECLQLKAEGFFEQLVVRPPARAVD